MAALNTRFAGRDFQALLDQLGPHLVGPARRNSRDPQPGPVEQQLLRMRQWIEAILDTLKGQLSLEQHGARRASGLYARVGQRLLAMAAAIWHNTSAAHQPNDHSSPTTTTPTNAARNARFTSSP